VTGRQGRRRKHLPDDLKITGSWEETLYRTLWRTRFGRGYGPIVRQTTERISDGFQAFPPFKKKVSVDWG